MTGFASPNFTQTPNDLFDSLLPILGDAELRVALVLIRKTFGYHQETTRLSVRKLAKATGLTARNAYSGATKLIERGLFYKETDGGVTKWGVVVGDTVVSLGDTVVSLGDTPSIKETVKQKSKRGARRSTARPPEHMKLSKAFTEITGIQWLEPKSKKAWAEAEAIWNLPLDEMLERANGQSEAVLRVAVKMMKQENWSVSNPHSVLKTFNRVLGERNLSGMKSATCRDPFASFNSMMTEKENLNENNH